MATVQPTRITLKTAERVLEVVFDDGGVFRLGFEYLRTHSPSAEVKGHGGTPMPPVTGKQDVRVTAVEPVGQYAVRLVFDDGHDSGLYTWPYLHALGREHRERWAAYLQRVQAQAGQQQ
jgi:DUF971 family protein